MKICFYKISFYVELLFIRLHLSIKSKLVECKTMNIQLRMTKGALEHSNRCNNEFVFILNVQMIIIWSGQALARRKKHRVLGFRLANTQKSIFVFFNSMEYVIKRRQPSRQSSCYTFLLYATLCLFHSCDYTLNPSFPIRKKLQK